MDRRRGSSRAPPDGGQSSAGYGTDPGLRCSAAYLRALAVGLRVHFRRAIACLAAAASHGISYVYMDRHLGRGGINSVTLSACPLLAAAMLVAIGLGAAGTPSTWLDVTLVVSIAILGLLGTGVAYFLNYQIIASEGATVTSTVSYLPVVAIVLGGAVLGERITLPVTDGITLVLADGALTRQRK